MLEEGMFDNLDSESAEAARKAYEELESGADDNHDDDNDDDDNEDNGGSKDDDSGNDDDGDGSGDGDDDDDDSNDSDDDDSDDGKTDDQILEADDADLSESELARKKDLLEASDKEKERILNAKDEDLNEEELKLKKELQEASDDNSDDGSDEKDFEEQVKDFAKKHGMEEDEAREELTSIKGIQEKYGKDSTELGRAYIHLQKSHSKLQQENKRALDARVQAQKISPEGLRSHIDSGNLRIEGQLVTKEALVDAYRKDNPKTSEKLDDDAIFAIATEAWATSHNAKVDSSVKELKGNAVGRRKELIGNIKDDDRRFIPEVKKILDEVRDEAVMSEGFNVNEILLMVKGQNTDQLVKEAFERGLKEGKQNKKVVLVPRAGGRTPVKKKAVLSAAKMAEARRMFPDMSDEDAAEMFKDIEPSMK